MDTRFWGPPAWRLFHTLSFYPGPTAARAFDLLPYILPCKFCRHSLTAIYERLPRPSDAAEWPHWFYKVHSAVNEKLERAQPDPPFSAVKTLYTEQSPPAVAAFPAWDFLFAVAYTHPLSTRESPIPAHPNCTGRCHAEKNRWNVLPASARLKYWGAFWAALPDALPAPWRNSWKQAVVHVGLAMPRLLGGSRRQAVAWLWRMRCAFEANVADPYKEVCKTLAYHASDCGGNSRSRTKTCRRLRAAAKRHTVRKTKPNDR